MKDSGDVTALRPSRSLLLMMAGAVFIAGLALVAGWDASLALSTAHQANVEVVVSLSGLGPDPTVEGSYWNVGNGPTQILPVATPVVNISGFLFALAPGVTAGTATSTSTGLTVSLPTSWLASTCPSGLTLTRSPFSDNYELVSGLGAFGTANVSVIVAGMGSWPGVGVGLLLPWQLSTLVVIQVTGSGNTSATVVEYHYLDDENYSLVARSAPFPFDTAAASVLTVSVSGTGTFLAAVNGEPRLASALSTFNPYGGPFAIWTNHTAQILGVFADSNNESAFLGPPTSCGTLLTFPFASPSPPRLAPGVRGANIVGPFSSAPFGADFYLAEAVFPGSTPALLLSVVSGEIVSLSVNERIAFAVALEA